MIKMPAMGRMQMLYGQTSNLDNHHGGVVLVDGYIYGSQTGLTITNGNWCCIDWKTGKKMWKRHWKTKGSIISAEGNALFIRGKKWKCGLLKVNPEKFELV